MTPPENFNRSASNQRLVTFDLLDPRLKERGFLTDSSRNKTQVPFADKRGISRLYGRSKESRFDVPLTPQEMAITHLIVQKQVMREDIIEALHNVLSLNPYAFYTPEVCGEKVTLDSRFMTALNHLDDKDTITKVFPELFGGRNNEHHIIPRAWRSSHNTGRRDGNVIQINTQFHTKH